MIDCLKPRMLAVSMSQKLCFAPSSGKKDGGILLAFLGFGEIAVTGHGSLVERETRLIGQK